MDLGFLIASLLGLVFLVGWVLGWVAFLRTTKILEENFKIRNELKQLRTLVEHDDKKTADQLLNKDTFNLIESASSQINSNENPDLLLAERSVEGTSIDYSNPSSSPAAGAKQQTSNSVTSDADTVRSEKPRYTGVDSSDSFVEHLVDNIKANWMVWIGGVSIGLAGLYLVKYSMDNGLLGPIARVFLAIVGGLVLHGTAYYLHRNKGQNDIFAAMAGGASLMLYAAFLAALHLYPLISPGVAFTALALVSLTTMLLAVIQGPVLAALGILGAYLVPIFASSGSNNISAALIYSFVVTSSALILVRTVKRDWLWLGTVFGAGLWWVASLVLHDGDVPRMIYLLALVYVLLAVESWDWRLIKNLPRTLGSGTSPTDIGDATSALSNLERLKRMAFGEQKMLRASLLILLLAWLFSIAIGSLNPVTLMVVLAFCALTLWIALHHKSLLPLAWLGFIVTVVGLIFQGFNLDFNLDFKVDSNLGSSEGFDSVQQQSTSLVLTLLVGLALLYAATAAWMHKHSDHQGYWASLGFLAPVVLLAVGYLRVDAVQADWRWALVALVLGAVYFNVLYRKKNSLSPEALVAIVFAAHLAYSLAVVIMLDAATLTLALAVQVISLAYLDRQFRLPLMPTFIKILLLIIIARLTLNPWLLTYPSDVHWSLWTYGGATVCVVYAAFLIKGRDQLARWLHAAAAHLLVLTIFAETRYQLYNGEIFSSQYSFIEAAINTSIWGALACVYRIRMKIAGHLETVYRWISNSLLTAAFGNYVLVVLLFDNPLVTQDSVVSATPILNSLLLAYGLPCIVAACAYCLMPGHPLQKLIGMSAAAMTLVFVSMEIRHLWHGELNIDVAAYNGELYTYSMVWLLMAISGSIVSIRLGSQTFYRASMTFLMLVVAKIFLVDSSDLSSLWRVAAFMGLGLSLLGLAYMHQKMGLSNFRRQQPNDY